ncbi:RNA polymerase sigma factor [Pseudonocardia sp. CA-107938]|uniref:RNA polymerase sigma factor n=1 Tax=Pseudonocardia sp. CA-107938 TaxID=3240021 RepID=UPI003D8C9D5D
MSGPEPVEDLLRRTAPQVLGVLVRRYGDFAAAEDAVQEALIAAADHWPRDGVPEHPHAWLIRTATRKLVDEHRAAAARRRREEATALEPPAAPVPDTDDTLRLLVLCCHPVLTPASAIALTLRAVGGLTTAEIAAAFLVPEPTMGTRISRAKAKVAEAGARFALPEPAERGRRVQSVLRVLYVMSTEAHTSSGGAGLHRVDLAAEAIRLTRLLRVSLPDDPEVTGLLALMLLTDARRPARTGKDGELIPLAEQDRARWDATAIAEGMRLVIEARQAGVVGEYQLLASIAAVHDAAPTAEATDWAQIRSLYELLERLTDNPVVTLNRAVAVAMTDGPRAGLALLDEVAPKLTGHHRLDAVRAHLLEEAGEPAAAARHYAAAAARAVNLPEQQYLTKRAARLRAV